jgi:hypothetical protein
MSDTALATVKDDLPEGNHMKMSRLDDSLFSKDLAPHYMKLAGQLCNSELVPKVFRGKPQDLFICWSWGYQVGMSPEQAMQCIAVINGKPCMWGDEMLALCMAHKDFVDIIEEPMLKDNAIIGYTCTVKRRNRADKVNVFTLDMAKKAGLLAKGGVWNQYPDRMLKLRARGFSLRDAFPDALKGIKSREEIEDYIVAEYKIEDSPKSRTEILKKDITNKGANNAEVVTQPVNTDSFNSDFNVAQEAAENKESGGVVAPREQETEAHKGIESISALDSRQLRTIKKLIKEKQFSEDRLTKALNYYEADSIEELPYDLADHFISQLNKA